jgi:hypothetical protein
LPASADAFVVDEFESKPVLRIARIALRAVSRHWRGSKAGKCASARSITVSTKVRCRHCACGKASA